MPTLLMLLVDWLARIENGDLWIGHIETSYPNHLPVFVADLQHGNFIPCDGYDCNIKLFASYGAQDRDPDRYNDGCFLCVTCQQKDADRYRELDLDPEVFVDDGFADYEDVFVL